MDRKIMEHVSRQSIPVTIYELLAYFVPGASFLVGAMLIYDAEYLLCLLNIGGCDIMKEDLLLFRVLKDFQGHTLIMIIFFVIFGYVLGFILSAAGSLVLEKLLVKHVIGYPFMALVDKDFQQDKRCMKESRCGCNILDRLRYWLRIWIQDRCVGIWIVVLSLFLFLGLFFIPWMFPVTRWNKAVVDTIYFFGLFLLVVTIFRDGVHQWFTDEEKEKFFAVVEERLGIPRKHFQCDTDTTTVHQVRNRMIRLFWSCYGWLLSRGSLTQSEYFLRLYGFARTMAFVFLLFSLIPVIRGMVSQASHTTFLGYLSKLLFFTSMLLMYQYVRLLVLHSATIFRHFLYDDET